MRDSSRYLGVTCPECGAEGTKTTIYDKCDDFPAHFYRYECPKGHGTFVPKHQHDQESTTD